MVTVIVDFAIALMTVLDHINKESFQRFKLRIGKLASVELLRERQIHSKTQFFTTVFQNSLPEPHLLCRDIEFEMYTRIYFVKTRKNYSIGKNVCEIICLRLNFLQTPFRKLSLRLRRNIPVRMVHAIFQLNFRF